LLLLPKHSWWNLSKTTCIPVCLLMQMQSF